MDPRGCSVFPTTQPSPHVDSPASRTLMPNEALILAKKSWFPHVCRINVQVLKLGIKWTHGDVPWFQRHNPYLMWTRLLRDTFVKRSTYFGQKSWFPHEHRINVRISKLSIKWRSGDVLRFQRHNPHLMSTRLLREHSCQTKHLFWAKIMLPPWVPDKRANF